MVDASKSFATQCNFKPHLWFTDTRQWTVRNSSLCLTLFFSFTSRLIHSLLLALSLVGLLYTSLLGFVDKLEKQAMCISTNSLHPLRIVYFSSLANVNEDQYLLVYSIFCFTFDNIIYVTYTIPTPCH